MLLNVEEIACLKIVPLEGYLVIDFVLEEFVSLVWGLHRLGFLIGGIISNIAIVEN